MNFFISIKTLLNMYKFNTNLPFFFKLVISFSIFAVTMFKIFIYGK